MGNRQQMTSTLGAIPAGLWNYDANDRLATDTYDNAGNTVSSAGIQNQYDFENHLTQHGDVAIVYDGDGNRVSETVGGVTTNYLVDTQNPTGYVQVMEELQGGSVVRTYTWGHWLLSQTQSINGTPTTSYYGYNGHGSVRFLTDASGAVTDTYDYDAFGNLISSTGTTPNNYLFAGEQWDAALGLYYNRARYLDVRVGRFWGVDPRDGSIFEPMLLHRYLYVNGEPVDHRDPSGEMLEELGSVIQSAATYLSNVSARAKTAFAAGGAAIGMFLNSVGAYAQNTARQVISLFASHVEEIESVETDTEVFAQNSRRVIDFLIRTKDGAENMFIEAKYSLPRSGAALERLAGQAQTAIESGRAQQVVLWSLRQPSISQIRTVLGALGDYATRVQFVDGVEGLYNYLSLYFH